jgi:short-subunit dehydrogenase
MIARGSGVVVNVSSMSGKTAAPYNSVYAATKHGLNGFTSSLAAELAGSGVHVGVVCPSFVADAGMWADLELKTPTVMREVSLDQVAAAVLRVIRGEREVLVTPMPVRPLLALRELFPALESRVFRAAGITRTLAARAKVVQARRS